MLIQISNQCDEGCPHCLQDSREDGGLMPFDTFKDAFAIGLSELKYPAKKAGEEPPSVDTWGVQVSLVFPDLDTLNNFRDILGELEAELKEKIKAEEAQQSLDFKDDQQQEETKED